eukprot:1504194-Rhodomonas_salina.2
MIEGNYLRVVAGVAVKGSVKLPPLSARAALVGSESTVGCSTDEVPGAIGVGLAVAVALQALALAAEFTAGMVRIAGLQPPPTMSTFAGICPIVTQATR